MYEAYHLRPIGKSDNVGFCVDVLYVPSENFNLGVSYSGLSKRVDIRGCPEKRCEAIIRDKENVLFEFSLRFEDFLKIKKSMKYINKNVVLKEPYDGKAVTLVEILNGNLIENSVVSSLILLDTFFSESRIFDYKGVF